MHSGKWRGDDTGRTREGLGQGLPRSKLGGGVGLETRQAWPLALFSVFLAWRLVKSGPSLFFFLAWRLVKSGPSLNEGLKKAGALSERPAAAKADVPKMDARRMSRLVSATGSYVPVGARGGREREQAGTAEKGGGGVGNERGERGTHKK